MDIAFLISILPRLLQGLWMTIQICVVSLSIGTVIGILLGTVRVLGPRPVQGLIGAYVTFVRGTPLILHVYAAFFLLPQVGVNLDAFWTGVVAVVFNTVGYQIEIVRAALESIDRGQREAAAAIGMTNGMAMRLVVLPQAARRMLPPLTNEFSNLIKASSVLSVIAIMELTKMAHAIIATTFRLADVFLVVSFMYFVIIQLLSWGSRYLELNVFSIRSATSAVKRADATPVGPA